MYTHIHIHVYIVYIYMYTYMYLYIYAYIYMYVCVCVCVCVFVRACVYHGCCSGLSSRKYKELTTLKGIETICHNSKVRSI